MQPDSAAAPTGSLLPFGPSVVAIVVAFLLLALVVWLARRGGRR